MPRKKITIPLEQQIDIAQKELEQNQNHLKQLLEAKNEKDRRERTHRLCERAGFMESIMPDTVKLTKEKFETFLSQILLNDYAHQLLQGLIQGDGVPSDNNKETPKGILSEIVNTVTEPQSDIVVYTGWQIVGGRVDANRQKNRLQVFFDNVPDSDIRAELKSKGFQWVANDKAWELELNINAIITADRTQCIQPITGEKPSELHKSVQASA